MLLDDTLISNLNWKGYSLKECLWAVQVPDSMDVSSTTGKLRLIKGDWLVYLPDQGSYVRIDRGLFETLFRVQP